MHIPHILLALISLTYKISLTSFMVLLIGLWELTDKINGGGGDGYGDGAGNDDDNKVMIDLSLINKTLYLHSSNIFKLFITSTF